MRGGAGAWGKARGALVAVALLSALLGFRTGGTAQAAVDQTCAASAYRLGLQSLTGPPNASLVVRITAVIPECVLPEALTDVRATIFTLAGTEQRKVEVRDAASPAGTATVRLGRVARRQRVAATVAFGPEITLSGQTRTLLKPDLVLTSVKASKVVLSGRLFNVVANIRERTPDVGTTAVVTVTAGGTVLATTPVAVAARRRIALKIPVTVTTIGRNRLIVTITAANPGESTTKNNGGRATVEVTEFRVLASSVLVPSFAG